MPAHAAPPDKLPLLRPLAVAALAVACLWVVLPRANVRAAASEEEVRALWVTRASLTTPAAIDALVASARASGFNTLLVQVRGRGDAYYADGLEPRADALAAQPPDFDPLQRVLDQARPRGLRVHAWVNVNLVASSGELPSSRNHVIYRHPDWLMVPRSLAYHLARVGSRNPEFLGRLTRWTRSNDRVEGLFLSPVHPEAASYTVAVVENLVRRYPVDGVHFDYIRYPGPEFDYSLGALRAFHADVSPELSPAERARFDARSIADLTALTDLYPERWAGFRRSRLNALLLRLRTVVKAQRPEAVISAAVFPDPDTAARERFQDWRFWAEQRWVDVICPMAYTSDVLTFAAQIARAREVVGPQRVWAGIGAYRLSPGRTIENIHAARRAGAHGIVLFSYDSLVQPPRGADTLATIGRAAFAP